MEENAGTWKYAPLSKAQIADRPPHSLLGFFTLARLRRRQFVSHGHTAFVATFFPSRKGYALSRTLRLDLVTLAAFAFEE